NRLRLHESGEQQSVRRLQESIWTLLDLNTIVQMQGLREHASGQTGPASLTAAETEQTFPGRNGRADPDVVVDLVRRPLYDIRAASPSAFRDSGLTTPGAVAQTLGEALNARMPQGMTFGLDPIRAALSNLTIPPAPYAGDPVPGTYSGGTTKLA